MNLLDLFARKTKMPAVADRLPGRAAPIVEPGAHFVSGHAIAGPYPAGIETAIFGLGCFWGAERAFWKAKGVWATAVGYAGGSTPNPSYEEVCSGMTGHNEVVLVAYDPKIVSYEALLKLFFESHDPTQGMRQGNDVGTQYRSGIYVRNADEQKEAEAVRDVYQKALAAKGFGAVTTEIVEGATFYFAETYHQQYLAKNPAGYCGLGGTGVSCPIGTGVAAA